MSDRSCARFAVLLLPYVMMFDIKAGAQSGLEANGSIAIVEPYVPGDTSAPLESGLFETTETEPPEAFIADVESTADRLPPPALIESKPLGLPAGDRISGTNVEDSTQQKDIGLIGKLDPRTNEVTKVAGALAVVIGLLVLVRSIMRRTGGLAANTSRPSGVLEILARYPVGRGQSLVVLKMARRVLLLHQNGSSMSTLSEVVDEHEVAALLTKMEAGANQRDASRFKKTLEEFVATHAGEPMTAGGRPPLGEAEIVDLTRRKGRVLGGFLPQFRKAGA